MGRRRGELPCHLPSETTSGDAVDRPRPPETHRYIFSSNEYNSSTCCRGLSAAGRCTHRQALRVCTPAFFIEAHAWRWARSEYVPLLEEPTLDHDQAATRQNSRRPHCQGHQPNCDATATECVADRRLAVARPAQSPAPESRDLLQRRAGRPGSQVNRPPMTAMACCPRRIFLVTRSSGWKNPSSTVRLGAARICWSDETAFCA